jgi:hypothetical protein
MAEPLELEAEIHEWIEHRNQDPKPFKWTAKAKPILASCAVSNFEQIVAR